MNRVMPSQVVQTIDELFPHAAQGVGTPQLQAASHAPQLFGIIDLIEQISPELLNLPAADYADLVLAVSTIKSHLAMWKAHPVHVKFMQPVKGRDAVTLIRRVLVNCPDEYPPPSITTLLFITDKALRESIRNDVGAATRALHNSEWKAATVLAGAAIEALLLWQLQQVPNEDIEQALTDLIAEKTISRPRDKDLQYWDLHHYIEVARRLKKIETSTASAARLTKDFRNLIHPGKAARVQQVCHRGTAHSALGALHLVIEDMDESGSE